VRPLAHWVCIENSKVAMVCLEIEYQRPQQTTLHRPLSCAGDCSTVANRAV